ncbi:hypothetical protein AHF37_06235 [Paragonimus kellicotti]|nr:hypothetical protein AHF37_06235 [Paragonimus kellicotti]
MVLDAIHQLLPPSVKSLPVSRWDTTNSIYRPFLFHADPNYSRSKLEANWNDATCEHAPSPLGETRCSCEDNDNVKYIPAQTSDPSTVLSDDKMPEIYWHAFEQTKSESGRINSMKSNKKRNNCKSVRAPWRYKHVRSAELFDARFHHAPSSRQTTSDRLSNKRLTPDESRTVAGDHSEISYLKHDHRTALGEKFETDVKLNNGLWKRNDPVDRDEREDVCATPTSLHKAVDLNLPPPLITWKEENSQRSTESSGEQGISMQHLLARASTVSHSEINTQCPSANGSRKIRQTLGEVAGAPKERCLLPTTKRAARSILRIDKSRSTYNRNRSAPARSNHQNNTLLQSHGTGTDNQRNSGSEYPWVEKKVRNRTNQTLSVHQKNKPSPKDTHKPNEWTHFTEKFDWVQASVVKLTKDEAEHYPQKQWDMVTCCAAQLSAIDPKNRLIPPLKLCYDKQNEASKTLPYTSKTIGQDVTNAPPKNKLTSIIREQEPSLAGDKPFARTTQQSLEYNKRGFKQSTTTTLINEPVTIGSQKNISPLIGGVTQSELINVIEKHRLTYVFVITNQGPFENLSPINSGGSQLVREEIQHIRRNPHASCIGDRLNRHSVQLSPVEPNNEAHSDRVITSPYSDRLKISSQSVQGKPNDTMGMELVKPDKVECPMTDNADVPYVPSKNTKNKSRRSLSALRSRKERSSEVSPNKMAKCRISETSNSNGPSFKAGSEDQLNRDAKQCGCFGKRYPRRQNLGNAVHHTQPGILEGTIVVKRSVNVFADIPNQTDSKSAITEDYTHQSRTHEVPLKIMCAQRENESSSTSDQVPIRAMTAFDPAESISSRKKYEIQGVERNMPEVRKSSSYSTPMKTYHSEHSTKEVRQNKVHRMDAPQLNTAVKCKCCTVSTNVPIVINSSQHGAPTGSIVGDPKNQPDSMFTYTYRIVLSGQTPDCMCEKSNDIGNDGQAKSNVHELAENSELPGSFTNGLEQRVIASADSYDHLNSPLSKPSGSDQRIRDSNKQPTDKLVIKHVSNRRVTEESSSVTCPAKDVCGTRSDAGLGSEELKPLSPVELSHKNPSDIDSRTETRTSEKSKHLTTNLEAKKCQAKTGSASHREISKNSGPTTQSFDSSQFLLKGIEQPASSVVQTNLSDRNSDSENQHLRKTISHVSELMKSTKRLSSEPKPTTYRKANENDTVTCVITVSQINRPETLSTSPKTDNSKLTNAVKSHISEGAQHDLVRVSNTVTSQQTEKEDKHSQQSDGPQSEHIINGIHVPYQHFYHTHTPDEIRNNKGLGQSNEQAHSSENRLRLWKNTISESEDSLSRSEQPTTSVQTTACSKNSTKVQLKPLESRDCRKADEQFHSSEATKTGETNNKKSGNASMYPIKLKRNSICDTQEVTAPSMSESMKDGERSSMASSNRPKTTQFLDLPNLAPVYRPIQNNIAQVHESSDPEKTTPEHTSSHSSSVKTSHKMTSYKSYAYSRKTNTNLHVPDVKEEDGGTQSRPCFSSSGSDQSQSAHGSESTISHFGSVAKGQTVMIDNQPPDTSNGFDNPPTKPFLQQSPRTAQHESDRADRRLDKSNETIPISSRSISRQPVRPCDQTSDPEKSTLEHTSSHSSSVKTSHKMTSYKSYAYSRKTNTNLHVPDVKEEDGGTQSRPCFSSSGSDQSQSAHGSESTISHFGSVAKGRTVMIDNQPPDTSNGFDNPPTKPFLQKSPRTAQHESDRADRRLDKSNETIPISSRSISRQPVRPCDQTSDPEKSTLPSIFISQFSVKTPQKDII